MDRSTEDTNSPKTAATSRSAASLLVATALATASSAPGPAPVMSPPALGPLSTLLSPSPRAVRRANLRTPQEQIQVDLYNTIKAARAEGRYQPQDVDAKMQSLRGVTRVRVDTRYRQLLRREERSGLDAAATYEFEEVSRLVRKGHGSQYLHIPAQAPVGKAAQRRLQAERAMTLGEVYEGKAPVTAWATAGCGACGRPNGIPNPACAGHASNGKVIMRRRGARLMLVAMGV